jgi:hypothetical protein
MGAPKKDVTLELVPLRLYRKQVDAAAKAAEVETKRTQEKWDRSKMLREWVERGRKQWEIDRFDF